MIIPWLYFLKEDEQLLLESFTKKWTINGPGKVVVSPFVSARKRKGLILSPTEFIKIKNQLTGNISIKQGPTLCLLDAYEEIQKRYNVFVLQHNEYMKVIDNSTGKIRVETGPRNVVLGANEEVLIPPTCGVNIDAHTAVMVRNTSDGSLKLITQNQVFFPKADEEVEEVKKRILLESHESVIVKQKDGQYKIIHGTDENSSFFLQPFEELIKLFWSSGINKDKRNLQVTHIDSRPKFMWYEFGVRTKDNVELTLGVTFFWRILDVEKMIATTDDAPGDICSHARSMIIQSVSKASLEKFLDSFNEIVKTAIMDKNDAFYSDRGVQIHSVEVRSVTCKEASTQQILQEIIQETTNRLNRLQKQQSENEVMLNKVKGDYDVESQKGELLKVKLENAVKEARIIGESEAMKIKAFLESLESSLSEPERIEVFKLLKKVDYIEKLGKSNANMFFTPSDVDLRIEAKTGK